MAIIQSCCCWRSLRRGCYAAAFYTLVYFSITVVTMGHFIEVERRYLSGDMVNPESESFLEPEKITPITVSLNITLLACSSLGLISCGLLILGVRKNMKYMLLPWIISMGLETLVEIINLVYLFYLQTDGSCNEASIRNVSSPTQNQCEGKSLNFNPVTSFLFTLDFFLIILNIYAIVCVISQFQEYLEGRGTAAFDFNDRQLAAVQYTAAAQHTTTTSSGGRRRSAGRPMPSRCDPDEFSEAPKSTARSAGRAMPSRHDTEYSDAPSKTITSVMSKPSRSVVKKHVQFPDEQSCIEETPELVEPAQEPEKPEGRVISSLWMELESASAAPAPER